MAHSVVIGALIFASKLQAESHLRDLMTSSKPADCRGDVWRIGCEHREFMDALVDLHPHRDSVIGSGIAHYCVQRIEYGHLRFLVKRTDGSVRDFSWRKCLSPQSSSKQLASALRSLVEPQIAAFRDAAFAGAYNIVCPYSNTPVTKLTCHIDHRAPATFAAIVAAWLELNHLTAEDIELICGDGYEERTILADGFLTENWREFHRERASLQVVSRLANLSILRRGSR